MSSKLNNALWEYGRKIEDMALPIVNKLYDCDFKRNDNDRYDVLDFRDENTRKIVEVKGRRILSTQYEKTIITAHKVTKAFMEIENGWKVYFIFAFLDKMYRYELKEDAEFECKFTGTACIQHYLIPIKDMTEITEDEIKDYSEPVPESQSDSEDVVD
tara:strand:- start:16 stop:489 length:474 start_codon:yes stop_codon:yes gene_type:complete